MNGQTNLLAELIVDNFAGGGGASTGIELATGRPVDIAINHDPAAILMHKTNHPYTAHYCESVWDIDPRKVCAGRSVGLAWFSPDCKHFSKAKGAALVDRKIRGLAWITLRWAGTVRPRVIILENVEEFQTWGPVRKGKPVKKLAGTTFHKFISQLEELGYTVEYQELVAADYGAPTTRKRFVLIARCDGQPIVWPKPTHDKNGRNGLPRWRSAAEIIDWSLPCPSIFDSKENIKDRYGLKAVRPLADNTMRRIIRGVDKFTIKSGQPFIVPTVMGGQRGHIAPFTATNTSNSVGASAGMPVHTVTTAGNQMLVTPNLMSIGQTGGGDRIRDVLEPVPTTVSKQETCLVMPYMVECNHSGGGHVSSVDEPYKTITAKHTGGLAATQLIQYTEQSESVRASGLQAPIHTLDASNRYGLTCANLVEYYTGGRPLDVKQPLHTVTSRDREAVVAAHVVKYKGTNLGSSAGEPVQTETANGTFACCKVWLAKVMPEAELHHWPEIRDLLNRHCGHELAEDELLLLELNGGLYFMAGIGLRMLSPRELYNAMGFPPDYKIDRDYTGKPYPRSAQVARCGNAVCPPLATAVVKANLPEWACEDIDTMDALERIVAV